MRTPVVVLFTLLASLAASIVSAQEEGAGAPRGRTPSAAPEAKKFLAPPDQVVAIRAARMFDSRAGRMVANPVIVVRGERIVDAGPGVAVPAGARVLDLGGATVLPGMIDGHVHLNVNQPLPAARRALIALANAQVDLEAGFTTVLDMDSRGGFNTVEIRDAINSGMFPGPRMQVVGQSINQRATNYTGDTESLRYWDGYTERKNTNSPWLARAAVREAKLHGVDWIKIYTTQDFVGPVHMWKADATLVASPSLTREEVDAIVDEAHRLGLRVACHTYGGEGMKSCLEAGVDSPNHLLELSEADARLLVQKKLFFVPTIDDLVSLEKPDLRETGGRNSRLKLMETAFKRAHAAGATIVFGSGATSPTIPHGRQADQFKYFVRWGMTPAQALQTAFLPAARMLNYGWERDIGSIEKGKYADIIAVAGNPLDDVDEMQRVRFVMKGGLVVRNDLR